jgi:putative membrane-bound dehydrogenase-like protein
MRCFRLLFWAAATAAVLLNGRFPSARGEEPGVTPRDEQGRPLNLDFETGTLQDWTPEGDAFAGQPIAGDTVARRRSDMKSRHVGTYWVGSYEVNGDRPQGTLTSRPFRVTLPFARFLIGGGSHPETRVEIVRKGNGQVVGSVHGEDTEDMKPVVVDLAKQVGQEVFLRLVDQHSGGWGHINFDDFRLYATRPPVPPRSSAPDVFVHEGLSPTEAARAMTVTEGFQVTLFAGEPDVVQPIAQAIDDRGRLWVAEAYSYPTRVPDGQARDRILIFEDQDGDGRFDTRKIFAEKLNLVSGLEIGFGGVWVGAAPQLLFIPDRDGDDRPDGPPVVLLDGWGYQDTHETLNSFIWGPDGWLYGCHGVFTHSRVGKPGTPDALRVPINAGIWRYHPTVHVFEVFAHGTSNPWGFVFDERGHAFLTSCVIPHLYHVIPGARYERQAGSHFNPDTYDDIKTIADHRHYLGANPHGGNGRSDSAGGGHAHAGALIYQGGVWPETYRNSILMNNIHGARLNRDVLTPQGSGFVGSHAPDFLLANDRWSQIVSLKTGPDGQMYMIDWYDKNQCHDRNFNIHDRTNGRIFKVSYGPSRKVEVDLDRKSDLELVQLQRDPNDWYASHARRILQYRMTRDVIRQAIKERFANERDPTIRLRTLWALNVHGGLNEAVIRAGLADSEPDIRAWTVRLATDWKDTSSETLARFTELAKTDPSPVVRLALASGLQRLPLEKRWAILERLAAHAEDARDHNLPLMIWYAAEPLATIDARRALRIAADSPLPHLLPFMVRRVAGFGTLGAFVLTVDELGRLESPAAQRALLLGLNEALKGRRQVEMPAAWPAVAERLKRSADPQVRSQAQALAVTFGDPSALQELRGVLADNGADPARRQEALTALVKARDPKLPPMLFALLDQPSVRAPALRALAAFDDPKTPDVILAAYPGLSQAEKRDALNTLAARLPSSEALLAAVAGGRVPSSDLSADLIRQLRNHKSRDLDARIGKVWGSVRETTGDRAALIAKFKAMLTAKPVRAPEPSLGRAVFTKTCQQCHILFGVGGQVGPDLTGSNRADLDYILANVLDPSALIGKDYQAHVVATTDGRVLTGLIRSETGDAVTLQTANETLTIPRNEIEERRQSDASMMPDDLWGPLSEHEVRSLVAYLASPAQVPLPEAPGNGAPSRSAADPVR